MASRLLITGVVQGVGYRQWAVSQARALGLSGWVRNRRDGSVEAIIEGTEESVQSFVAAARRGPPAAQVKAVDVEDAEVEVSLGTFEWRPTA